MDAEKNAEVAQQVLVLELALQRRTRLSCSIISFGSADVLLHYFRWSRTCLLDTLRHNIVMLSGEWRRLLRRYRLHRSASMGDKLNLSATSIPPDKGVSDVPTLTRFNEKAVKYGSGLTNSTHLSDL